MPLVFESRGAAGAPVEVQGVLPQLLPGLSLAEIERLPIQHGNRQRALAEFFHVTGDPAADLHVWRGELRGVHYIAHQLSGGAVRVEGAAGRHAGAEMTGGSLSIDGDAGDWLGAEMRGGAIRVAGSAGNHVGAAYRGSPRGMKGGEILVAGDAGHEVGVSLRRGVIAVAGRLGDFAGANLIAGTIIAGQGAGSHPGAGMRRGTIAILAGPAPRPLPTFRLAGRYSPTFLRYLLVQLAARGFPVFPPPRLAMYHGDLLAVGKGDLWLPA